jgi:hypothetical protein
MVKRSTWVVVALFGTALIALLLVQRNPGLLQSATPTPAATAVANLLTGWSSQDVVEAVLIRAIGGTTTLTRGSDGAWNNAAAGIVGPGKVEQLLSELLAAKILVELPSDYSLEDLHLAVPAQTITLRASDDRQTTIKIGGITPTQSGYYVKVDDRAPAAVSKYAIETVLRLFDEALPAADVSPTP